MKWITNHIAREMMSKGILGQSSLITKGILSILIAYELVNGDGEVVGGAAGFPLAADWPKKKLKELDVKVIRVYVDWSKQPQHWKKIYAEIVRKKIEVEFLKSVKMTKEMKIEVELIT